MSVKRSEKVDKMSVEYVNEAKGMADFILTKVHRGPGDTVEAAIHRAERMYGANITSPDFTSLDEIVEGRHSFPTYAETPIQALERVLEKAVRANLVSA